MIDYIVCRDTEPLCVLDDREAAEKMLRVAPEAELFILAYDGNEWLEIGTPGEDGHILWIEVPE